MREAAANKPLFYQDPLVLNREEHADLKIAPSPKGLSFAASAQSVLISMAEFFDACRSYPVVFSPTGEGQILPVALLGLEAQENLFVDGQGNWLDSYVPAYVRRYPFITGNSADGSITVYFDNAFDGFNQEGGTALFEDGEPSQKMQEIMNFLHGYHAQMQQTAQFTHMLGEFGILHQINAQARLNDGRSYDLNGMYVIEEKKLAELKDEQVVELFRNGSMALIHAHLLSLRNMRKLVDLKTVRSPKPTS